MNLVQLANFVRIAELQSLSRAAAVIRIAQPALSRQLRHLETELGAQLVVRHARGVSLTAAGEALLISARRVLLETEHVRDAVRTTAATPIGRVAVGVPASLAKTILPDLALAVRRKWPALRLHLTDGSSASLHAQMIAGDLDLAILYADRTLGPLLAEPLLSEELMVVGTPAANKSGGLADFLLAPLIIQARPNRLRLLVDSHFADHGKEPLIEQEVDSFTALIALVKADAGLTILPYSSVADEVASGELVAHPLANTQLRRTLVLASPTDRQPTPAITAVKSQLRELVTDRAKLSRWTIDTHVEASTHANPA